jgi:hypothetical protein
LKSLCTKRVPWIVGSTNRHLIQLCHPGINAVQAMTGRCRQTATRVIAPAAGKGSSCEAGGVPAGNNSWSLTAEAARRFGRKKREAIKTDTRP